MYGLIQFDNRDDSIRCDYSNNRMHILRNHIDPNLQRTYYIFQTTESNSNVVADYRIVDGGVYVGKGRIQCALDPRFEMLEFAIRHRSLSNRDNKGE